MPPREVLPSHGDPELRELRIRLVSGAGFLVLVMAAGVLGYRLIAPEAGWIDALYMTVITLTTVGFTEVIPLASDPAGRIFTIALILVGMGGVLYFVSTATAFVLEGQLGHVFWRRRMHRRIARMDQHLIVCGSGGTAIYTSTELEQVRRRVVAVCGDAEAADRIRVELPDLPVLVGDPTAEETLREAGVERAAGIAACTRSDKDNLIVTLTARQLNPAIRIVSRISDIRREDRLRNVGADSVVSPHHIGALRIASELIRPAVVSFLDVMLRDGGDLRVDEVTIPEGSMAVGRTIEELDLRSISDALLVAVRRGSGGWTYNPPGDLELAPGAVLILLGTPEDVAAVADAVEGRMIAPPVPVGG